MDWKLGNYSEGAVLLRMVSYGNSCAARLSGNRDSYSGTRRLEAA